MRRAAAVSETFTVGDETLTPDLPAGPLVFRNSDPDGAGGLAFTDNDGRVIRYALPDLASILQIQDTPGQPGDADKDLILGVPRGSRLKAIDIPAR